MQLLHVLAERGYSGGEVQLRHLLEHLACDHDNRLVLQPDAAFTEVARQLSIPFDVVRMRNGADLLACVRLRRLVRQRRPDLVHLACSRAHKLGALAVRGAGMPVRVVTRRMDYPLRWGAYSRWLYGVAMDAAVVISRGVGAQLERVGVPASRIFLIHEGVDASAFAGIANRRGRVRAELGLAADAEVVLCAASLRPRKGQVHLVRAFASLVGRRHRARLLLAGEGDQRAALQAEAARLHVTERVSMPGRLPIADALAAADLACLPSLREGLSVFALEAQAAGLAVVASEVGGLPEAVEDGVTGVLVGPGDEPRLAAALAELLEDAPRRRKLGAAGQARVRAQFSARVMAECTERLYEDLVARRAPT